MPPERAGLLRLRGADRQQVHRRQTAHGVPAHTQVLLAPTQHDQRVDEGQELLLEKHTQHRRHLPALSFRAEMEEIPEGACGEHHQQTPSQFHPQYTLLNQAGRSVQRMIFYFFIFVMTFCGFCFQEQSIYKNIFFCFKA